MRDVEPITAHERYALDTGVAQLRRDAVGPRAKVIGHHDHSLELAVDTHEDLRAPRTVPTVERRVRLRADAVVPALLEPPRRPDRDPSTVHAARDAPAGALVDLGRHVESEPAGRCRADEALGKDVYRELIE